MRHDLVVTNLVTRARDRDYQAWDALVERHAPLTWSICRRQHPDGADAEDLAQTVWLRLLDQLAKVPQPGHDHRLADALAAIRASGPVGFHVGRGYSKTTAAGCWLC
jgi:hypothetical protein